MDPLTAGMNLLASINALFQVLIEKAPPEQIGEIISRHEARILRLETWLGQRFKFLQVQEAPK